MLWSFFFNLKPPKRTSVALCTQNRTSPPLCIFLYYTHITNYNAPAAKSVDFYYLRYSSKVYLKLIYKHVRTNKTSVSNMICKTDLSTERFVVVDVNLSFANLTDELLAPT